MKPTTTETFQRIIERAAGELTSGVATKRANALAGVSSQVEAAVATEVAELEARIANIRKGAAAVVVDAHTRVESRRRELADAIVQSAFASNVDALPARVATFRREPSRQNAIKCREAWDLLNAVAIVELDESLGEALLGAILVDDVLAQNPAHPALNVFARGFGDGGQTLSALVRFTREETPQVLERHLLEAETAITRVATQARNGVAPTPRNRELFAARRSHATARELTRALEEINKRHDAAELEQWQRSYVPPPTREQFFSERLDDLYDAATRMFRGAA